MASAVRRGRGVGGLGARDRAGPRSTAAWWPRASRRARSAETVEIPDSLAPDLASALRASRGRGSLLAPARGARGGAAGNVVVTSGTASGKSLSFNLPVLDDLARDRSARALYLYPTKALAQDQARKLSDLGLGRFATRSTTATRRGRTGPAIRRRSNLILTNPDMLHVGVLPHHKSWGDFLANLGWVVVDEAHTYRGVFGSHVANVLRRLRRARRVATAPTRASSSPRRRSPTRSSSPSGWSASRSGWSTPTARRARGGGSRCGTRR